VEMRTRQCAVGARSAPECCSLEIVSTPTCHPERESRWDEKANLPRAVT
jgi:hypothetical protein